MWISVAKKTFCGKKGANMSKKKKFLIYLSAFLLSIVAVVGGCFAIMFLSPGTEILGYKYITLNKQETVTITQSDLYAVQAVKIMSDLSSISIYPGNTDEIVINYNQNISGYVKSVNADYNISTKKQSQLFSTYTDVTEDLTTMVIKISEPKGWLSYSESNVKIALPQGIYKAIYASCGKSGVTFTSTKTYKNSETNEEFTKNISCEHIFLQSTGDSNVTVVPNDTIKTFNFQTEFGTATISGKKELSAEQIIFSTNSGTFDFYKDGEGTLNLSRGLVVNATGSPTVKFCNLNSNASITTNGGDINLGNVGKEGYPFEVKMYSSGANLNISTLYGVILSEGADGQANNIAINHLKNTSSELATIHSGAGNITINTLESDASLTSTSGNITVYEVGVSYGIYAYSTSGTVSINYTKSATFHSGTLLQVFTKSGSVKLQNISCKLELTVLDNSSQSPCELTFTAICNSTDGSQLTNKISAPSRDVKITFIGSGDGLSCRMLTTKVVYFDSSISSLCSKVDTTSIPADRDSLLIQTQYKDYSYQYRLFYINPEDAEEQGEVISYHSFGILLIDSASTTVYHRLSA